MKTHKWILLFVSLNLLALAFTHSANGQEYAPGATYVPGIPGTNYLNPGGSTLIIEEFIYSTVQPVISGAPTFSSVLPGDVVLLANSSGDTNMDNWAAVVTFFNPADTNFTQGLEATEDQAFFPVNGTNTFANFTLAPDTVYVPVQSINADGSILAYYEEIGPAGGIVSGQELLGIMQVYPTTVPEPSSAMLLGSALAAAVFAFRKKSAAS